MFRANEGLVRGALLVTMYRSGIASRRRLRIDLCGRFLR